MIYIDKEIVWTPRFGSTSLSIMLESSFTKACLARKRPKHFEQIVWANAWNEGAVPSTFLLLHEGSILVKEIHRGRGGVWLAMNGQIRSDRPLVYHGHNEESDIDQLWLARTFQAWVQCASILVRRK